MRSTSTTPHFTKRILNIKKEIKASGRKQKWIAEQVAVHQVTLNYVLNFKLSPSYLPELLEKLENLLNIKK